MTMLRTTPGDDVELLIGITAKACRTDLLRVPSGLRKKSLVVGVFISHSIKQKSVWSERTAQLRQLVFLR